MTKDNTGWLPRNLPNGVYCSPACGGNCTRQAYDRAVENSAALARTMGMGWKPRIWENLGWWWSVDKGVASLRPYHNGDGYTIFFNTTPQVVVQGTTAKGVLEEALDKAWRIAERIHVDRAALTEED